MESGILSLLLADATVSGLLGNRIVPVYASEAVAAPYATYMIATSHDEPTLGNKVMTTQRIQFDIWSPSYSVSRQIETAIANVLRGFAGLLSDGSRVLICQRENIIDSFPSSGRLYRIVAEYEITFS